MHIAAAAVVAVPVVAKINLGYIKVKITKKELAEIIREEVQNKLNEFVEFDDEGNPIGATPPGEKEEEKREVDKDGIPLKAPFPPGIKTTRELIKKFPYNSDERKLFRKWYTTYGPGKGRGRKKGFKNKVAQARDKAIARRDKREADKAERDKAVAQARDKAIARRNTINPDQFKQTADAEALYIGAAKFLLAKKEFNEKLGVTGRKDYIDKTGAKDFKERKKFGKLYDKAVRFYNRTKKASEDGNPKFPDGGVVLNILDKEKIETQKERRFANLKIFFGSVIDESPTNDTKVVNVTGDTITAQDVADKLKRDKEAKALGIPTENEFIKAAFERVKKGQRKKGWWGQDTKFRGNLNLWKSSMLNKYRNNIEDFKASLK